LYRVVVPSARRIESRYLPALMDSEGRMHMQQTARGRIINVRKLVALDIALHGARFIVGEFAIGIALCAALGVWLAVSGLPLGHAASAFKLVLGAYFLCLALNYVPMLLYAIALARSKSARQEAAAEMPAKGKYPIKYAVQQLLLVVPLAIPLLALGQEMRRRA
jgi:hypothetical protein